MHDNPERPAPIRPGFYRNHRPGLYRNRIKPSVEPLSDGYLRGIVGTVVGVILAIYLLQNCLNTSVMCILLGYLCIIAFVAVMANPPKNTNYCTRMVSKDIQSMSKIPAHWCGTDYSWSDR